MAVDPVSAYQDSLREYNAATNAVQEMSATIDAAAKLLELNWRRTTVVDETFPSDVTNASVGAIDPATWPTAKQIAEILNRWHRARKDRDTAWEHVPADRRTGLQPPRR